MSFKQDYRFCGLSREQVAYFFSVTQKTISAWEKKGAPPYAERFLLLYQGRLDFFGKAWTGFRITPECLESPSGEHIYPGEAGAIKYLYVAAGIDRTELCNRLDEHGLLKVKMAKYKRPKSLVHLLPEQELLKLMDIVPEADSCNDFLNSKTLLN